MRQMPALACGLWLVEEWMCAGGLERGGRLSACPAPRGGSARDPKGWWRTWNSAEQDLRSQGAARGQVTGRKHCALTHQDYQQMGKCPAAPQLPRPPCLWASGGVMPSQRTRMCVLRGWGGVMSWLGV